MGGDDSSYFMKLGPVGWFVANTWDEKGNSRVVQIFLSHDEVAINAIQFQYYADDGTLVLSNRYGMSTKVLDNFDAVRLNYPTEYITGIAGRRTNSYIRSITFSTNLGEYGPFGPSQPTTVDIKEFSVKLGKERQFGGFHGNSNTAYLVSIGLYVKPIMNLEYSPKGNIVELAEDGES